MYQEGIGKRTVQSYEVAFSDVPPGEKFHRLTPRVFCLKFVVDRFGLPIEPPSPYNAVSLQRLNKTTCGELMAVPDDEVVKYEPV